MVVVFGSINLDLVARVARIPAPGETVAGSSFATAPGGKGANQALAARQAGADGPDVRRRRRRRVRGAGAREPARGRRRPGRRGRPSTRSTGVALIGVDDDGENAIVVIPGANAHARAAQVPDTLLAASTTVLMQLETPLPEVAALAARARRAGARTVLNAAPAAALPDALLRDVDVLLVNEHEAALVAAAAGVPAAPGRVRRSAGGARHDRGRHAGRAGCRRLSWRAPSCTCRRRRRRSSTPPGRATRSPAPSSPRSMRDARWRTRIAAGLRAGSAACAWRGAQRALPAVS